MLASLPLDSMIATLGIGIAKAQEALDKNSLNTTMALSSTTIDVPVPIDPQNPSAGTEMQSRSLLSLGFTPAFYHFTEATLDIKIEMKMQMEENLNVGGSLSADIKAGPVAIAGTVSADYGRKYGAESSAMTQIHLVLASVPPPTAFLEWARKLDQLPAAAPPSDTADDEGE